LTFAADNVADKEAVYRKLLANYLAKPQAITSHRLNHHGKLWSFPESKAFRNKFRTFKAGGAQPCRRSMGTR
jgi:hypothetical protein